MEYQLQKQTPASLLEKQGPDPIVNIYNQKLNERQSEYTLKDVDRYALGQGFIMLIVSTIIGWILTFRMHPVIATISAGAIFILSFITYLHIRNRNRAAREIYNEQEQDIDTLRSELPKRVIEAVRLGQLKELWVSFKVKCSPCGALPDELEEYARKSESQVELYLDGDTEKLLAKTPVRLHRINAVLAALDKAIAEQERLPQLISRKSTNRN